MRITSQMPFFKFSVDLEPVGALQVGILVDAGVDAVARNVIAVFRSVATVVKQIEGIGSAVRSAYLGR